MSVSASYSDIARRYATALFSLAEDAGLRDGVEKDLRVLAALTAQSAEFTAFSKNTALSRDAQAAVAAEVAAHLGLSDLTKKFIGTLALNRRLPELAEITAACLDLIAAAKNETVATVVSAVPLDEAQATRLVDQLQKMTGLSVRIEQKVDAGLIGGLTIRVGALSIDNSVKTKLERLHRALTLNTASADCKKMKEVA